MAKTRDNEEQLYYYFKVNIVTGNPYAIKVTPININMIINRIFVEMTEEQKEFYLEHPDASVMEVWKCELIPPYIPPTPDVKEYAEWKNKELENECFGSITVSSLELSMAMDKANNITADSYYSLIEARNIVSNFRSQSKKAMTVFDTYSAQIDEATTIEQIDSIYDQAIQALNTNNSR